MADVNNSMGPIAVTPSSRSLMTFDPQQAALVNYEKNPPPPTPVSVNAWTGAYEEIQRGRIIGNLVV